MNMTGHVILKKEEEEEKKDALNSTPEGKSTLYTRTLTKLTINFI